MRRHYEEQGLDMPPDFFPPQLLPAAEFYLSAFRRLSDERPTAVGFAGAISGVIPFIAIERYASRFDLDLHEFMTFDRILRRLDQVEVVRLNTRKPTQ